MTWKLIYEQADSSADRLFDRKSQPDVKRRDDPGCEACITIDRTGKIPADANQNENEVKPYRFALMPFFHHSSSRL
jgi:hypothetical protein